jgi:hypothetical protein
LTSKPEQASIYPVAPLRNVLPGGVDPSLPATGTPQNAGRFEKQRQHDPGGNPMQTRMCLLSAVTLGAAMLVGTAANAGDLPKEGTFTATYASAGTFKATSIGKEHLATFDENGLLVGNGLLDHMTNI